ncbi:hypothetical protein [Haladaptatus salinisoli]|uniref:hypothetical protein n=1 Tax=Haladaptatus salinisoli TaxID=2884876 RepID=UPI001D0B2444|nr:hypothetical protein [Haladaptatus salinisoli]
MSTSESAALDTIFTVLSDSDRRDVLSHLADSPDDTATVEELAGVLRDDPNAEIRLRHVHLPRLAATAMIDYDARTGAVRYRGCSLAETLLRCCLDENPVRTC